MKESKICNHCCCEELKDKSWQRRSTKTQKDMHKRSQCSCQQIKMRIEIAASISHDANKLHILYQLKIKVTLIKNNTAELQYIDAAGREEHCGDEEKTDKCRILALRR